MADDTDREAEVENLAAEMLEDLEAITGIPIHEMMAEDIEEPAEFEEFEVYEEPTEDNPLDLDNPDGEDTDEYFDAVFDEIDVDPDTETDAYSED